MLVLIHYAEIALKGRNRPSFERQLLTNIRHAFRRHDATPKLSTDFGRILCEVDASEECIRDTLTKVFGISSFSFVHTTPAEKQAIVEEATRLLEGPSIAVKAKRADKNLSFTSLDLAKEIGDKAKRRGLQVELKDPDQPIHIEVTSMAAYLYTSTIQGPGGLPVGTAGKVLVLFSGGIDSAVAAYLMMKRGCRVDYLHVHSLPENKSVFQTKIAPLLSLLDTYQPKSTLYVAPYHLYEFATMGRIPDAQDLVLFKHFLLRLADRIGSYRAIVTGDALAQVASQTLQNLEAISQQVHRPVFRPLIAFDKQEIIAYARAIGTFNESIKQYKDCCSIVAKHPSTSTRPDQLRACLGRVDLPACIDATLGECTTYALPLDVG